MHAQTLNLSLAAKYEVDECEDGFVEKKDFFFM